MTAYVKADYIIPPSDDIEILQVLVHSNESIIEVQLQSTKAEVPCPNCSELTKSVHCAYFRSVRDLPCGTYVAQLSVKIRCFKCSNPACPYKFFSEQIPNVTRRYQRRTPRAEERIVALAIEYAAEGCERLGSMLGLPYSADTFLRAVRRVNDSATKKPRILGIDDFAFRKGQRYGAICYDDENHEPVDLLDDRDAQTVSQWMTTKEQSPEIVTRDGSMTFKDAIDKGAPEAKQVSDRFHIMKNFSDAVRNYIRRMVHTSPLLYEEADFDRQNETAQSLETEETPKMKERRERWQKIHHLHADGMTITAIARELHIRRATVREYLRLDAPPTNKWTRHKIDPYLPYLSERWQSGAKQVKQLFSEIKALGYTGGYSQMADFLSEWRDEKIIRFSGPNVSVDDWIHWWFKDESKLEPENRIMLQKWRAQEDQVEKGYQLIKRFLEISHEKQVSKLSEWLSDAESSEISELRRFAKGLRRDEEASKQAFCEQWSNGPVEAAVNSLKALKRQMFGRAKLDLLRKRYLQLAMRRRGTKKPKQIQPSKPAKSLQEVS